MKLANLLKSMSLPNTPAYRAGEMLLECERVIEDMRAEFLAADLPYGSQAYLHSGAFLAKLRGEA